MLLYANTSVFMWKSIVFWFCTVWCLHTRCEMRHFYTLRCPAPFWLIQSKPYRNRFIIAKVTDKSLGTRFLWPTTSCNKWSKLIVWICTYFESSLLCAISQNILDRTAAANSSRRVSSTVAAVSRTTSILFTKPLIKHGEMFVECSNWHTLSVLQATLLVVSS